jgi:hypothetical protein
MTCEHGILFVLLLLTTALLVGCIEDICLAIPGGSSLGSLLEQGVICSCDKACIDEMGERLSSVRAAFATGECCLALCSSSLLTTSPSSFCLFIEGSVSPCTGSKMTGLLLGSSMSARRWAFFVGLALMISVEGYHLGVTGGDVLSGGLARVERTSERPGGMRSCLSTGGRSFALIFSLPTAFLSRSCFIVKGHIFLGCCRARGLPREGKATPDRCFAVGHIVVERAVLAVAIRRASLLIVNFVLILLLALSCLGVSVEGGWLSSC